MSFNYFDQAGWSRSITALGRSLTAALSQWAPALSARIGLSFLIKPNGRRRYQFEQLVPREQYNLNTQLGNARVQIFGQGERTVVLSHGWADNSHCFQALIADLVARGYRVAALDHVGHGHGEGKRSHLLAFIEGMELLLARQAQDGHRVETIIGHSMGAVATLNLPQHHLLGRHIILVAVPIHFFELMFATIERFGISRKMMIRVLERITRQYGTTWTQLQGEKQLGKLHDKVLFIHDEEDRFAPFADIQHYAAQGKIRLVTTRGLGHRRILGDTEVIQTIQREMAAA